MQRLINNNFLSITIEAFYPKYTNLQTIRWARKPRWLPTAKTKLFRIPQRPVIPQEDKEELKRLHNIYRTQIKSLKNYFKERYSAENLEKSDVAQHEKNVREDFIRCNKINDAWNEEIKVQREKRLAQELEENIQIAKKRFDSRLQREAEKLLAVEETVRQEKEAVKTFITRDHLDEAIETAINNPVDYNFSIDINGNKTYGREIVQNEKVEIKQ